MLSEQELAEIRARCEAATKGPWSVPEICPDESCDNTMPRVISLGQWVADDYSPVSGPEVGGSTATMIARDLYDEDAAFVASARTDIPALLDDLAAMAALAEAREALIERMAAFWRPVARDMEHDILSTKTVRFLAQDFLEMVRAALAEQDGD